MMRMAAALVAPGPCHLFTPHPRHLPTPPGLAQLLARELCVPLSTEEQQQHFDELPHSRPHVMTLDELYDWYFGVCQDIIKRNRLKHIQLKTARAMRDAAGKTDVILARRQLLIQTAMNARQRALDTFNQDMDSNRQGPDHNGGGS